MTLALRPYQDRAKVDIRNSFATGHRAPLLVCPTAGGKTALAASILESHIARNPAGHGLVLVHRRELMTQARDTITRSVGLRVRTIQGSDVIGPSNAQVTVAMIPTLVGDKWLRDLPRATIVITDEAHHAKAATWSTIANSYGSVPHIGLTATPMRADGKPLGDIFDDIVTVSTVRELTQLGYLVPARVFAPAGPSKALAEDPVTVYLEHCRGQKTVVFCTNVEHAKDTASRLRAAGVAAESVDGKHEESERDHRLRKFSDGRIDVVCNVNVLTEGWNEPACTTLILARGAEHAGQYLQMVGRVLRSAPGKTHANVWDLRGIVHRLGLPDAERTFSLTGEAITATDSGASLRQCRFCGAVFEPAARCPNCKRETPAPEPPEVRRQRIAEYVARETADDRAAYWHDLRRRASERGYKDGWVRAMYRVKYGSNPGREVSA